MKDYLSRVTFEANESAQGAKGRGYLYPGLDVGSTTTKAVLLRTSDNAIIASCYLRTNGDPIQASRKCYREIHRQLEAGKVNVEIVGRGLRVPGRQIAGLTPSPLP